MQEIGARARGDALGTKLARASVLGAAMQVFSKQGIDATRVEDLLVAAGLSRRTFYKYFTSKEDVVAALYEVSTGELVKAIDEASSAASGAPLAGVHQGIDTYLDFHEQSARGLLELVQQSMRSGSLLGPRRRWFRNELVRVLDAAVQRLDGRRLDRFVFTGLISALEGVSLEILEDGAQPADVARARAAIHALVDQALGVPGGRALPTAEDLRARARR